MRAMLAGAQRGLQGAPPRRTLAPIHENHETSFMTAGLPVRACVGHDPAQDETFLQAPSGACAPAKGDPHDMDHPDRI